MRIRGKNFKSSKLIPSRADMALSLIKKSNLKLKILSV